MGTLVEEVQFSEDEEDMVDIEATNVSYERLGEENAFLKKQNKNLESQLRNVEEKNCQLNRDIGNLNYQLKRIKSESSLQSPDVNQNREETIVLREKVASLSHSLARLKIKYKMTKSQLKEYKGQRSDSSQGNDSQSSEMNSICGGVRLVCSMQYISMDFYLILLL